jgi:hypothetical protein
VSYLDLPRLHFAGVFLANPSTINNAIENYSPTIVYNNEPPSDTNPNSVWWNPDGQAFFKIPSARITSAVAQAPLAAADPVSGAQLVSVITGEGNAQFARLVDLDPDQQAVSLIVGLAIRIANPAVPGTSLTGVIRPMCIRDIWSRVTGGTAGGIQSAGCMYQSVIEDLQWTGLSGTPGPAPTFLDQLHQASPEMLSIKFSVDGYNGDPTSPTFAQGRIVGAIGPYREGEPAHFVAARRLFQAGPADSFPIPINNSPMNPAPFQFDGRRLSIDLGNSVPTVAAGGSFADLGAVQPVIDPAGANIALPPLFSTPGEFAAQYEKAAGIYDIDAAPYAGLLVGKPLALRIHPPSASPAAITGTPAARLKEGWSVGQSGADGATGEAGGQFALCERVDGILVDRSLNALRLEKGAPDWSAAAETATEITGTACVVLTAMRWGNRAPGVLIEVSTTPNSSQFRDPSGKFVPVSNEPMSAIAWSPQKAETGAAGELTITFTAMGLDVAQKPAERANVDGQVYLFTYNYFMGGVQPLNFLVFEDTPDVAQPTWWQHVYPIFFQYARLYPAMRSLIDLSNYQTVANKGFNIPAKIQSVLGLPMSHPAFMPVTRDLSLGRRNLILKWFASGMPEGNRPASQGEPR